MILPQRVDLLRIPSFFLYDINLHFFLVRGQNIPQPYVVTITYLNYHFLCIKAQLDNELADTDQLSELEQYLGNSASMETLTAISPHVKNHMHPCLIYTQNSHDSCNWKGKSKSRSSNNYGKHYTSNRNKWYRYWLWPLI